MPRVGFCPLLTLLLRRHPCARRQSINWAPGTPAIVEGGEMAYVIKEGGLLGHGFDYNLFINGKQAHSTLATRSRRALLALDLSMVGKTAGAHVGTSMQFF